MTRDEIIDGLEIYTVGGLKKNGVHITVEELQKFIDAIKALSEPTIQALEDARAEIEANIESIIGKYDSNTKPEDMPSRKIERNNGRTEAIDIINRKIAEVTKNEA